MNKVGLVTQYINRCLTKRAHFCVNDFSAFIGKVHKVLDHMHSAGGIYTGTLKTNSHVQCTVYSLQTVHVLNRTDKWQRYHSIQVQKHILGVPQRRGELSTLNFGLTQRISIFYFTTCLQQLSSPHIHTSLSSNSKEILSSPSSLRQIAKQVLICSRRFFLAFPFFSKRVQEDYGNCSLSKGQFNCCSPYKTLSPEALSFCLEKKRKEKNALCCII